ncbi:carbon-nitrogen hydrolase family protein [Cohnella ginsengisoli]|uniref:Carbon-nitrogen hydrolase family protein n=1 Tax=Cohnella ginsengisoli TaxID=425004 RepID=A0A9X4KCM1_9BACL|nr:carbon-nitrogen hydrolase family protein [Cohnella ginsengisoli]MDG0789551.1 carbon-nitrogen hydrolase family protein [Cohnella ginsengisoli]
MKMRVSAVQFALKDVDSVEQWSAQVKHYVRNAAEYGSQFVLFPEFITTPLLGIGEEASGAGRPIDTLPEYTELYTGLFSGLARQYGMYLFAGTHVTRREEGLRNTAFLFKPDGSWHMQDKLHITPSEVQAWNVQPGDGVEVIDTPFGKIGLLTCYDIEFPEIVRMVRAKGANVIFCPSCTDDRHGFHRVRYCCHARTVENQIYVVTTGTVGSLTRVDFMRANYGQAAVIAPNDIPFPPGGILSEGDMNADMLITADLDLSLLDEVREAGSVTTWRDRRVDLYTDWQQQ